jgi:hypothetical protein
MTTQSKLRALARPAPRRQPNRSNEERTVSNEG